MRCISYAPFIYWIDFEVREVSLRHLFFTLAFNQEFRVCVSYSRDWGPTLPCRY